MVTWRTGIELLIRGAGGRSPPLNKSDIPSRIREEATLSAFEDEQSLVDFSKLTEEQLQIQLDFIESRVRRGLEENNAFDMLEAESRLANLGAWDPPEDVVKLVLGRIGGQNYHRDFNILRISSYMRSEKIVRTLEEKFTHLKQIWREQDTIRYFESHRVMLENVARRADELNALKVAADPYLKTLDEFFERSFNEKKLSRFPELKKVHDRLLQMRREGSLSKTNLIEVLHKAIALVDGMAKRLTEEVLASQGGDRIKPNRVIAVYYCLLDALMYQGSDMVRVDDEFREKVMQDFRAAYGSGTKRFVLSALLRISDPSFAEIAAESHYYIKAATAEKLERKELGEPGFKSLKVSLEEFQNYNLYKTAGEVVAKNVTDSALRSLLFSYNPSSLLLGLRALELAELPGAQKLRHLRVLLDLGTMHEYSFSRAVEILSKIECPDAAATLSRLLVERYGWRKSRIPPHALKMIQSGFFNAGGSGAVARIAAALASEELRDERGVINLPYEGSVYDAVFDKLATRFEKNIFHGVNELALHRLARAAVKVALRTRHGFAMRGRVRLLGMLKYFRQVSQGRARVMADELAREMEVFQQEVLKRLPFSERDAATTLLIEAKGARGALASVGAQTPPDEGALMRAAQVLKEVFSAKQINAALLSQTKRALKQLHDAGSKLMSRRDVNVRAAESFDRVMLPVRYSASSRAIIIAGPLLHRYGKDAGEEQVEEMVRSLGLGDPVKPAPAPDEPPSESRTKEEMEVLQEQLSDPEAEIDPSELGRRVAAVAAGAVEHNLEDVLEKLRFALYEVGAPPVARFAFLAALPISQGYATMWSELLAGEDENVLLALKTYLDSEEKQLLKQLVPDLLDLID